MNDEAGFVLQEDCSLQQVSQILEQLQHESASSRTTALLLSRTVPNLYPDLTKADKERLWTLLSTTKGLSALVLQLPLVQNEQVCRDMLDVLEHILTDSTGNSLLSKVEKDTRPMLLSLLCSGKLVAVVAEVENRFHSKTWMGNGTQYFSWLAQTLISDLRNGLEYQYAVQICQKTWSSGYFQKISDVLLQPVNVELLAPLMAGSTFVMQRNLTSEILRVAGSNLPLDTPFILSKTRPMMQGLAYFISRLCSPSILKLYVLKNHEINVYLQYAIAAAIGKDHDTLISTLNNLIALWADSINIKSLSICQQECQSRMILIMLSLCTLCEQKQFFRLPSMVTGISNRLSASQHEVRELGMIVGQCISNSLDETKMKLNFDIEASTLEKWSVHLNLKPQIGGPENMEDIYLKTFRNDSLVSVSMPLIVQKKAEAKDEIKGSSHITYEAFEGDDPDSDDDPTIASKQKERPPVYIRDLISYLRSHESYDRIKLGLMAAPNLIRRKKNYGKELTSHALELCGVLLNLKDSFEMEDFESLRFEAMSALITSCPETIAPHIAQQYFTDHYGQHEHMVMLTCLSYAGRELASTNQNEAFFPSKQLPSILHSQYSLDNVAESMKSMVIGPTLTGKVIRKSQNLLKDKSETITRTNNLSPILGVAFIYPLTSMWWTNLKHFHYLQQFQPILLAHYIKTLAVLVYSASSLSPDMHSIVEAVWKVLLSARLRVDPLVIESLAMAFLTLLQVISSEVISKQFANELMETRQWAKSMYEEMMAEKPRLLAGVLLTKISEIAKQYETRFLGFLYEG